MNFLFVAKEKSSQSQNSHILALRDEKNRRFVSYVCKGEVN